MSGEERSHKPPRDSGRGLAFSNLKVKLKERLLNMKNLCTESKIIDIDKAQGKVEIQYTDNASGFDE